MQDEQFDVAQFDIAIVGGGPTGLAMALALTRFLDGVKVALLDRREFTVPNDQRAFAIADQIPNRIITLPLVAKLWHGA